jgi:hypothetical protein
MYYPERSRNFGTNAKKPMGISSGQPFGHLVFALANVGRGFVKKSGRQFISQ